MQGPCKQDEPEWNDLRQTEAPLQSTLRRSSVPTDGPPEESEPRGRFGSGEFGPGAVANGGKQSTQGVFRSAVPAATLTVGGMREFDHFRERFASPVLSNVRRLREAVNEAGEITSGLSCSADTRLWHGRLLHAGRRGRASQNVSDGCDQDFRPVHFGNNRAYAGGLSFKLGPGIQLMHGEEDQRHGWQ
jgi:hypothetical protein